MKILLVGEYSRLHNSLKEGLVELGHEVTIISTGDYFKDYPSDIKLRPKFTDGILKKIKIEKSSEIMFRYWLIILILKPI